MQRTYFKLRLSCRFMLFRFIEKDWSWQASSQLGLFFNEKLNNLWNATSSKHNSIGLLPYYRGVQPYVQYEYYRHARVTLFWGCTAGLHTDVRIATRHEQRVLTICQPRAFRIFVHFAVLIQGAIPGTRLWQQAPHLKNYCKINLVLVVPISTTSEQVLSHVRILCTELHSAILTGSCRCTVISYCKRQVALRTCGVSRKMVAFCGLQMMISHRFD